MNLKTKGTILTLALSVAICAVPQFVWAGVESDPNLTKLENKFFQHDYARDDVDTRLDRLEKLVFGEAKTGDDSARLKSLVAAVPDLDAPAANTTAQGGGDDGSAAPSTDSGRPAPRTASNPDDSAAQRESQIEGGSQYPAVSAMEKKLLGKDYASEPIVKRLERLETKVFGKPVQIADLSDRVDRLKSQTGIDLARTPPPGSDWADDEDSPLGGGSDITYVPEKRPVAPRTSSYNPDDDPMFNNAHSSPPPRASAWSGGGGGITSGSGSYGGGSSGGYGSGMTSGTSGSYGSTPPRRIASALPPTTAGGIPPTAPDVVRESGGVPPTAMGLSQQVGLLENELFRRSYTSETIPIRLNRLEATVFPGTRPASDMTLPDRVRRLLSAVPISQPGGPQVASRPTQPQAAPEYDPNSGMPPMAPQRGPSGFSKIINGLGNLLMGGPMGAYPVGSNLVQDPSTGFLIDTMTGNMINPTTGQVVRQGMGVPITGGYNTYNGFNNGLSPIGSPYGMSGGGMRFGFGGSGIRFGGGSMGGMGTGINSMGMPVPGYPIGTQSW